MLNEYEWSTTDEGAPQCPVCRAWKDSTAANAKHLDESSAREMGLVPCWIGLLLASPHNAALLRVQEAKNKVVEAAVDFVRAKTQRQAEALQGELYGAVKALEAAERAAKDDAK